MVARKENETASRHAIHCSAKCFTLNRGFLTDHDGVKISTEDLLASFGLHPSAAEVAALEDTRKLAAEMAKNIQAEFDLGDS